MKEEKNRNNETLVKIEDKAVCYHPHSKGIYNDTVLPAGMADASKDQSILALLAGLIAPLFAPLGLNDWRICTALISGVMAKESLVSTLGILYGGSLTAVLTTQAGASLLVFSLLYTPCIAAIGAIKRELGGKWAIGVVLWQCMIAWIFALLTRIIFGLF